MELINIESKIEKFLISARILKVGDDILIIVNGGKYHIGAVGVSIPTDSIITGDLTAYTSIITLPSHKEDTIVKLIGEKVSKALKKNIIVIAGIHFDDISKSEIEKIIEACKALSEKIIKKLG